MSSRTESLILVFALTCGISWAAEAPIAMSDPGGQGLDLDRLDVRLAAHGPLALTELEQDQGNRFKARIFPKSGG